MILHVLFLSRFSGTLNRECVIWPPCKIEAVTLDNVVISATKYLDLTVARRALYRNVFPVTPGPSTYTATILDEKSFCNTESYAYYCPSLRAIEDEISSSREMIANSSFTFLDLNSLSSRGIS